MGFFISFNKNFEIKPYLCWPLAKLNFKDIDFQPFLKEEFFIVLKIKFIQISLIEDQQFSNYPRFEVQFRDQLQNHLLKI